MIRRDLLTTAATPPTTLPGDFTLTETPRNLRRLGHSWSAIGEWAMSGRVRWEPGEREKHEGTK
jgi:hypothetical protein